MIFALALSACSKDTPKVATTTSTSGDSTTSGQTTGNDTGGGLVGSGDTTTSGNTGTEPDGGAGTGGTAFIYADPINIELRTDEETPISGSFQLSTNVSEEQLDNTHFSVLRHPINGTLERIPDSLEFTYTPNVDFFGLDSFVYSSGTSITATVQILVNNVNDPPSIVNNVHRVIEQDRHYFVELYATDPDEEQLTFSAQNLPNWLSIDAEEGTLSGVPTQDDVGLSQDIVLRVTDSGGLSDEVGGVSIEVLDINDAPTLSLLAFPRHLDARQNVKVNVFPRDIDDDGVTVSVEPNDFFTASVSGSEVSLTVSDVKEVTKVNMVAVATDLRGRKTREIVELTFHPLTASGKGRTLHGHQGGSGVHLMVLGDGFRAEEQLKFRNQADRLISLMRSDIGMAKHFQTWNVHMIETPSVDSGIDSNVSNSHEKDTVYNTGFYCSGVERIICGDQAIMFEKVLDEYGESVNENNHQVVVLVNEYIKKGGSGGAVAIASVAEIRMALHEMGHSFANLADEYVDNNIMPSSTVAGEYVEGSFANVSRHSDASIVPWAHWIDHTSSIPTVEGESGVGLFEGAFYRTTGFYRPTSNSLMRDYSAPLGPVNSEQWVLSVYKLTTPILSFSPETKLLNLSVNESATFAVTPVFDSTVQSVEWRLNEQLISGTGGDSPSLTLRFPAGEYNLSMVVRDITGLIRKAPPHEGYFSWSWKIVVE